MRCFYCSKSLKQEVITADLNFLLLTLKRPSFSLVTFYDVLISGRHGSRINCDRLRRMSAEGNLLCRGSLTHWVSLRNIWPISVKRWKPLCIRVWVVLIRSTFVSLHRRESVCGFTERCYGRAYFPSLISYTNSVLNETERNGGNYLNGKVLFKRQEITYSTCIWWKSGFKYSLV